MARAVLSILLALAAVAGATEAPLTDAPSTEAPSTDAPSTEVTSTEAPSIEATSTKAASLETTTSGTPSTAVTSTKGPSTETTLKEAPSTDASSTDAPSTKEAPSTEAPSTDASSQKVTSTNAPSKEVSSTEAPSTEAPSTEAPTSTTVAANRGNVSTSLKTAVGPGDSVLRVVDIADFLVGDVIIIDKGLSVEEIHTIKRFKPTSSIVTSSPLQNNHKPGASVQLRAMTTTLPKTTTTTLLQAVKTTLAPMSTVTTTPAAPGSPCDVVVSTVTTTPAAPGSPCDVVVSTVTTTPAPMPALADPCATAAVSVRLFEGKDAKRNEAQTFTLGNAGLLVMGFACAAALTVGVRSLKRRSPTRTFTAVNLQEGQRLEAEYDEQEQPLVA